MEVRMAKKSVKFTLTAEQDSTLRMWVGGHKTEQRYGRRAQVILGSADGLTLKEICARSGLTETNVLKWRRRFLEEGLDGLKDKARVGRPPTITPWERANVMRLACEKPLNGASSWSVRELARVSGVSATSVHRILSEASIKPHKTHYWCGKSPDPEFAPKQAAIIGLYMDPTGECIGFERGRKISYSSFGQDTTGVAARTPKNLKDSRRRIPDTALRVCLPPWPCTKEPSKPNAWTKTAGMSFLLSLNDCIETIPAKSFTLFADNLPLHKHPDVMDWVSRRKRLTLHFTPTYASWLNQIEIWFNIFARDVVKGGVWHSKKDLVNQIMNYVKCYNRDRAHPFTWTYTGKVLVE